MSHPPNPTSHRSDTPPVLPTSQASLQTQETLRSQSPYGYQSINSPSSTPSSSPRQELKPRSPGSQSGVFVSGTDPSSDSEDTEGTLTPLLLGSKRDSSLEQIQEEQSGTNSHPSTEAMATPERDEAQHKKQRHVRRRHHGQRRAWQLFLATFSQIGLFLFFGTLIAVLFKAPWEQPYSWHPILMGLYGFLSTEAILFLQPLEKRTHKKLAATIHGIVQILSFIFSVGGFVAIWANKNKKNKPHLTSNHAIYGTAAMAIFFFQIVFGLLIAYAPRRLFQRIGHTKMLRIHRVVGYVSIALLWLALWLSVLTNWMNRNFDKQWIFALATGMTAVGVTGQITPSRLFVRRRRPTTTTTTSNSAQEPLLEP